MQTNQILFDVDIIQFDENFNFKNNIISKEILIENKSWILKNAQISISSFL